MDASSDNNVRTDPMDELAKRLLDLHALKKLRPGVHGQMLGQETYQIIATGEQLSVLEEAADEIERLRTYEVKCLGYEIRE